MIAAEQNFTITDNGKTLSCDAADYHSIAVAGPHDSEYHPAGSWLVILGFDAAKAISAADDERLASFVVSGEAEARRWLALLARMYFAAPDVRTRSDRVSAAFIREGRI